MVFKWILNPERRMTAKEITKRKSDPDATISREEGMIRRLKAKKYMWTKVAGVLEK